MARIRSIKPEFWTSETIAALPVGARLTFIGLWSYVDDNGVGIYNERLIASSLYPMDDPREALARVREALANLLARGRIALYEADGRRYIYITTWDEHQKVDRPRKPRYPRPGDATHTPVCLASTSEDTGSREDASNICETAAKPREDASEAREKTAQEQGTGSREQGVPPTAGRETAAAPATTDALVGEWIEHCPKRPPRSIIGQVGKHVRALLGDGIDPTDVRHGLAQWASRGLHPSVLPAVVNEVMNAAAPNVIALWSDRAPRSTTDDRVAQALAAAEQVEAELAAGTGERR